MKIKPLLYLTILMSLLAWQPAYAEKTARSGAADSRIKTFAYSENDVYRLKGHYGFSTVIEFSPREAIDSVSIGDSEAWQIVPSNRANILFIKPILDNAQTNMTVLTSKRMYTFELSASKATSHRSSDLAFRIKFVYADEVAQRLANFGKFSNSSYDPFQGVDGDSFNFDYSYSGSNRLKPKRVFDDGVFTYLQFEKFETMPAVFEVQEDRTEALVNFNIKGKYMVISSVGAQYTLRDGNLATCIFNDAYPKNTGTEKNIEPIAEIEQKSMKVATSHILPTRKPNFDTANAGGFFTRLANNIKPVTQDNLNN